MIDSPDGGTLAEHQHTISFLSFLSSYLVSSLEPGWEDEERPNGKSEAVMTRYAPGELNYRKELVKHLFNMHNKFRAADYHSYYGGGHPTAEELRRAHEVFHFDNHMGPLHTHPDLGSGLLLDGEELKYETAIMEIIRPNLTLGDRYTYKVMKQIRYDLEDLEHGPRGY